MQQGAKECGSGCTLVADQEPPLCLQQLIITQTASAAVGCLGAVLVSAGKATPARVDQLVMRRENALQQLLHHT